MWTKVVYYPCRNSQASLQQTWRQAWRKQGRPIVNKERTLGSTQGILMDNQLMAVLDKDVEVNGE